MLDISIFRKFDTSTYRNFEGLFDFTSAGAVRVVGARPERFAGVGAFLGNALDHRLTAFRAERRVCLYTFLLSMIQAFGGEGFGKTAFFGEGTQAVFELFVEHRDKALTKIKKASCGSYGVVGVEPGVKFMLLSKDMHGTLVSDIVCISYLIELYGFDLLVFRAVN